MLIKYLKGHMKDLPLRRQRALVQNVLILLREHLFDLQSSDPNDLVIFALAKTLRSTNKVAMAQIGTPIAVNGMLDVQDVYSIRS